MHNTNINLTIAESSTVSSSIPPSHIRIAKRAKLGGDSKSVLKLKAFVNLQYEADVPMTQILTCQPNPNLHKQTLMAQPLLYPTMLEPRLQLPTLRRITMHKSSTPIQSRASLSLVKNCSRTDKDVRPTGKGMWCISGLALWKRIHGKH